ncbi:PqqD family protein [Alkalihalobacterium chitinilyticum]|uniref:PqqD family protein n=1 Tax=Alkalihalobacterium chitinilyticum TaxID=2980103 RepID=A0ABT5VJA7_9BACI|nr:hypothetical protein [Alkalihalobacterium chitinilyticum]MDE5415397.1 hypothetical protein [Alkalihalobacterium chitinilyticum]
MEKINLNEEIKGSSVFKIHPYKLNKDGEDYILGRLDTNDYVSLSEDAYAILKLLEDGASINDILHKYQEDQLSFEDVKEFIISLVESNIVHKLDDHVLSSTNTVKENSEPKRSRLAEWLFSKTAWVFYAVSLVLVPLLMINESLRPKPEDLFLSNSGVITFFTIIIGTWITVFVHEFGHAVAAKKEGIGSKITWGYRWIFLVIETDVTDIWSIKRNRRYAVYLGGPAWSNAMILGLLLIQLIPLPALMIDISKFFVLLILQSLIFQFLFFLRTDLYYVLANYLRIDNLNELSKSLFLNLVTGRIKKLRKEVTNWSSWEKKLVSIYTFINVVGTSTTLILFLAINLPVVKLYIETAINKIYYSELFSYEYWDGIAFGTFSLNPFFILLVYYSIDLYKYVVAKKEQKWTV